MKEEIPITLLFVTIIVLAGGIGWWTSVGADRSEYRHCVAEYDRGYEGRDIAGGFRYCYEKTYK